MKARSALNHAGKAANISAKFDVTTTYTRVGADIIPTQKVIIAAPTDGTKIKVKSFTICMRDLPAGNKGCSVRFVSKGASNKYLTGLLSVPLAAGSEFGIPFEVPYSSQGYFEADSNAALALSGSIAGAGTGTISPNFTGNIVYSLEQ